MSSLFSKEKLPTLSSSSSSNRCDQSTQPTLTPEFDSTDCNLSMKEFHKSIENQIVRCTEITCVYSSTDECSKSKISHNEEQIPIKTVVPREIREWTKVVNATLDGDNDILLEVDTGDAQCAGLKDVQSVELVIAVQSAIKKRQELIEEWKNKTFTLTDQMEKLQKEKYSLEKSNLSKDTELECLARKLHDLYRQYKSLSSDSKKLKKELEVLKKEYRTLSETYNCTIDELKLTKHKLDEAIESERVLECRLKKQIHDSEKREQTSYILEKELEDSRRHIKSLMCAVEETTKDLQRVKHTLEEYKNIEVKLKNLQFQYKTLKDKYVGVETSLSRAFEENSSLKEILSKLNLTIENLTADKNELVIAVRCLNGEKNCLLEKYNKVHKELTCAKKNFSKVQTQLRSVESEVEMLTVKIDDLEKRNQHLHGELNAARDENKSLNDNLKTTIHECSSLSRALTDAQAQLELQQRELSRVENNVRSLLNEKRELENMIGHLNEEHKKSAHEVSRLNNENSHIKNNNNELSAHLNRITVELNESITEIKHLNNEIDQLRHTIETERAKHENAINRLYEKITKKSQEWKEYVTNEVQRLRNKRRADIKKYLEMNKDLEIRLQNTQDHSTIMEAELNENITDLRRQLDYCKVKLEETISEARSQKKELLDRATAEQNKFNEILTSQKLESQWLTTELEAKIQNLVQKSLDDETTIHILNKESSMMKEKIKKLTKDSEAAIIMRGELKNLLEIKYTLECELSNCRNLLSMAEQTNKNFKDENAELSKRLFSEMENSKLIQHKVLKLKKFVGKKDAKIEVLHNTIAQLKEQLTRVVDENISLKDSLNEIEEKRNHLSDKVRYLNQELADAKRALLEAGEDKLLLAKTIKDIEVEIQQLEAANMCLKNELQLAKENQFLTEKALDNSHQVQMELKDRVFKAESAAAKSNEEASHLKNKLLKMQEHVKKLQADIKVLQESYQYNDTQNRKKIDHLENKLVNAHQEVDLLRQQLEKSEKRISRLRESIRESEKSFFGLINIFDELREAVCKVLCVEYVAIDKEEYGSNRNHDDSCIPKSRDEILATYKREVHICTKSLFDLKQNETELTCKLANTKKDFEKLSNVMKELQNEYTHKVEKLYNGLKDKDNMIKELEKELVKIQLEAANADEIMAHSLKVKIEDQQQKIKRLHDEKGVLQSEILCLAKKVNELESSVFELVEKIKCVENKNSKLQVKNVSMEGDLEKLALLLKEARDKEREQIHQYKQMMMANRELMEKIRNLRCELDKNGRELDEAQSQKSQHHTDSKCCLPCRPTAGEKELEHEVKVLTEKLIRSQKAEHDAKSAINSLEENFAITKNQLAAAESEKANLEGWVSHLQQLVSGGYASDASIPQQLAKAEDDKRSLQHTIDSLRSNLSTLHDEKHHMKNTVDHLSKCNHNLEATITSISKNRDILESELHTIQDKISSIFQGVKSNDTDLSVCSKDIMKLFKSACNLSKSMKVPSYVDQRENSDRRITAGIKTFTSSQKIAEDSQDSLSITIGCQTTSSKADTTVGCCIKPFSYAELSSSPSFNVCNDCNYMDLKHNDISDIKTDDYSKRYTRSLEQTQSTKNTAHTEKGSKTFV